MLKHFIYPFLLVGSFIPPIFSEEIIEDSIINNSETLEEPILVDLDSLSISNDGIFIWHGNDWQKIDYIFEDDHGQYRATLKNSYKNDWDIYWTCPKCQFKNGTFTKKCRKCGYNPRAPSS